MYFLLLYFFMKISAHLKIGITKHKKGKNMIKIKA